MQGLAMENKQAYDSLAGLRELVEAMQASALCCPSCDNYLITSLTGGDATFLYGSVELTYKSDVRMCTACGEHWTDVVTDYAQREAIVQHLQRVNAKLRQGLSDVIQFARGSAEADIAREAIRVADTCDISDEA